MALTLNTNLAQHLSLPLKRRFSSPQPIPPQELYMGAFLSDGPGSFEMVVDGSVQEVIYRIMVPPKKALLVHSITFSLLANKINLAGFGSSAAVLTNGISVHIHAADGSRLTELIEAMPIKSNYGFGRFGNTIMVTGFHNTSILTVRWDIAQQAGFVPYLQPGQYIAVHIRDNLVGKALKLQATCQGRLVDV